MIKARHPRIMAVSLAMLALTASGCTVRLLDFTAISSKNVNMPVPQSARGNRVTGTDFVTVILGIPLGTPNLKEALDRAIESAGPGYDALIDGVLYRKSSLFKMGFQVEGTPIKTSALRAAMGDAPILYHSSVGKSNDKGLAAVGVVEVPVDTVVKKTP